MCNLPGIVVLGIAFIYTWAISSSEDVCTKDSCGSKPVFIGKFHIPTEPLPRMSLTDPKTRDRIKKGLPTLITDSEIFTTKEPWSLKYLKKALKGSEEDWKVFKSENRRFLYYGEDTNYANYKWTPPHTITRMKFPKFVKLYKEMMKKGGPERVYFQSAFYQEFTAQAVFKYNSSATKTIADLRQSPGPGGTPWFYIGMPDVLTPIHFDYSENTILQIYGHKRVILAGPEHYGNLYPYPKFHPHDRQSQVDLENPDYVRFPNSEKVKGYEAILKPGDALFIPTTWWHMVESEHNSETVSLSVGHIAKEEEFRNIFGRESHKIFTSKDDGSVIYQSRDEQLKSYQNVLEYFKSTGKKQEDLVYQPRPDGPERHIHVRRAIEQMIAESTGNFRDVGPILKEMYEGRFDHLEFNDEL